MEKTHIVREKSQGTWVYKAAEAESSSGVRSKESVMKDAEDAKKQGDKECSVLGEETSGRAARRMTR